MRKRLLGHNAEAILWVIAGTALFSLVFASGKFAGDAASPLQIVFLRYVGGALTLSVIAILSSDGVAAYRSTRPFKHLGRALFGSSGGAAIIYATANMPVVDATAISLMQVVFMILLGVLVLGERIDAQKGFGILLCCAGAILILGSRGAFHQFDLAYVWPAAVALFGAVLIGIETILIKMLTRLDRPMTVLLYVNFFGVALMAIPGFLVWKPIELGHVGAFLLLGPLAIAAQYCIIRGYQIADVSVVAPIDFTWLIFAAVIGMVFFDEFPTLGVLAGAAIIIGGGCVLAILKTKEPVRGAP